MKRRRKYRCVDRSKWELSVSLCDMLRYILSISSKIKPPECVGNWRDTQCYIRFLQFARNKCFYGRLGIESASHNLIIANFHVIQQKIPLWINKSCRICEFFKHNAKQHTPQKCSTMYTQKPPTPTHCLLLNPVSLPTNTMLSDVSTFCESLSLSHTKFSNNIRCLCNNFSHSKFIYFPYACLSMMPSRRPLLHLLRHLFLSFQIDNKSLIFCFLLSRFHHPHQSQKNKLYYCTHGVDEMKSKMML